MNQITLKEIEPLSDDDLINLMKKYPFGSQWEDQKALNYAEHRIALIQGNLYLKTGDVSVFTKKYWVGK